MLALCTRCACGTSVETVKVYMKGPSRHRQSALRGLMDGKLRVTEIRDVTPIPYNGCRPPKSRRL